MAQGPMKRRSSSFARRSRAATKLKIGLGRYIRSSIDVLVALGQTTEITNSRADAGNALQLRARKKIVNCKSQGFYTNDMDLSF